MQTRTNVDRLLADSFKELVLKKPIEKITIQEITDKAGVIRPTFYNHFQDKYDLLEWIIRTEVVAPIIPLLEKKTWLDGINLIFHNIMKSKDFFCRAAKLQGQNSFADIVKECTREILYDYIKSRAGDREFSHKWMTPEMFAEYYAQSMTFIVMTWIQKDMIISPEEMTDVYRYIVSHSMEDILDEMQ